MKKIVRYFAMLALSVASVSCGNESRHDSTEMAEDQNEERLGDRDDDDAEFAVEAADGGLMDVKLGTLALTKASSPQVKQFAQMVVDEHTKANNELKSLAQQKNISLPTVMGNEHQREYDNLSEKTGSDFDKAYMDLMVKDHKEDIKEFEEQAEEGEDPEIKAWASSKVPTLQKHLQQAETIQEAVKDSKSQ